MKNWLESMLVALTMYSRLPLPSPRWTKENLRYALFFLPVIGLIEGIILCLLSVYWRHYALPPLLYGATAVWFSIWLTGGIHFDGFCDTADAAAVLGSPQKRMAVLYDPHIGSFAALRLGSLLLLQFAAFCVIGSDPQRLFFLPLGFVLSRTLTALLVYITPASPNSHLVRQFEAAHSIQALCPLLILLAVCVLCILILHLPGGIFGLMGCGFLFWRTRTTALRVFQGMSGDLAGYLLVRAETLWLVCVALFSYVQK